MYTARVQVEAFTGKTAIAVKFTKLFYTFALPSFSTTMKPLIASLIVLAFVSTLSCTKTNNVTTTIRDTTILIYRDTVYMKKPLNPIVGLWVGKYVITGQTDSFYYSLDIQPTGNCITTAIANDNSVATWGPWQLNGTNFTSTVTQMVLTGTTAVVQNLTATYDSTAGTLIGQAAVVQGPTYPSLFRLIRVQ
jgi:hypothetical protein